MIGLRQSTPVHAIKVPSRYIKEIGSELVSESLEEFEEGNESPTVNCVADYRLLL